jgi:hypothetical protein
MTEYIMIGGAKNPWDAPDWESGAARRITVRLPGGRPAAEFEFPSGEEVDLTSVETAGQPLVVEPPYRLSSIPEVAVRLPPVDTRVPRQLELAVEPPFMSGALRQASAPPAETKAGGMAKPSSRRVRFAPGLRLRRRGHVANVLERLQRQSVGWWRDHHGSDLTTLGTSAARSWLAAHMGEHAPKVTDTTVIKGSTVSRNPDGEVSWLSDDKTSWGTADRSIPLLKIPFAGTGGSVEYLWVCPELLAQLSAVRMFRSITSTLLASLRGHSRRWADEMGVSALDLVRFLPGTIVLAMLPTVEESTALCALRGFAGEYSVDVLGALERGVLKEANPMPLGNFLRRPFSWLFRRQSEKILAPGVRQLQMVA